MSSEAFSVVWDEALKLARENKTLKDENEDLRRELEQLRIQTSKPVIPDDIFLQFNRRSAFEFYDGEGRFMRNGYVLAGDEIRISGFEGKSKIVLSAEA